MFTWFSGNIEVNRVSDIQFRIWTGVFIRMMNDEWKNSMTPKCDGGMFACMNMNWQVTLKGGFNA